MALVLIFAGLMAGGAAALVALWAGVGFLGVLGAYMLGGALGLSLAAGILWRRATRRAAGLTPPADWGLPAP